MPEVIVTIDPQGNVQVEAASISGSGCEQLTAAIEQAIGRTTEDVKKPEFLQAQPSPQGNHAKQQ